ncbi:InlB B-repeat-containing protein [Bifidobacterium adolescentis]|uniref:InlB B-repeat-containing protein n=1 Tax=Bifidobacterium adolescentis TaxID=1680 RepID=UPI0022E71CDC|nr:InlB B-repeat-containing protein [Bifidobacterium adolescentis]
MGFLTRLLAGLTAAAALGAGLTGTANAVDTTDATGTTKSVVKLTADDTNNLPDHIVNGSFDYPSVPSWTGLAGSSSNKNNKGKRFATINPGTGKYGSGCAMSTTGKAIPNWNRSSFAWNSTQGDAHYPGMSCEAGNVELNYDSVHHNQFAELTADQQGTAIYQDVKVTPGTMMKWSLKHSSATSAYVDKMQVMIGEPYKETAQEATRIASENGNKVGEKMTTISTPTTSDRADNKKWDTYSGTYLVPDGVTTVRFTFKSVASAEWYSGNDLDDIEFSCSYKLTYDKNSSDAAGEVPSNQRGKENTVQPAESKTNGTVKTVADDTSNLPDHLVNGDFEYPGANVLSKNRYDEKDYNWWGVSRKDKMVYDSSHETQWVSLPSTFDSDKFAWDSTEVARVQNGSSQWHTNEVELQRDSRTGNMYAELCAYQAYTSIRQYIHTTPGTLYKVRLKHASLSRDYLDKMQVLVGPAGNEQPVSMTRVESQNGLDATGESTASTTVSTHASNEMEIKDGQGTPYSSRNHNGQWATYEGVYVATSDVTSFTFESVDAKAYNLGNLLDDIVFDKAYRLSYDKNAQDATGSVPSNQRGKENTIQPAKARATGTVKTVADDDSSKSLTVNPGFDVPDYSKLNDGGLHWMYVNPAEGKAWSFYDYINPAQPEHQVAGLSQATFGWQELTGGDHKTTSFELHREKDGNVCADVHGSRTIGQTIDTQAGVAYTVSIRHSGRSKGNAGSVQVLVGPDKDHLQPLEMSRMNVSRTGAKYGDKTGKVGTVITTHSDSVDSTEGDHPAWDHSDDWETYSGTYVAAGGKTVFAYRGVDENGDSVSGNDPVADSVIDDLSFKLAYRLSYDKNAADAAGSIPSDEYGKENTVRQAKSKANGSVKLVADDDVAEYAANGLPKQIMNGDFDHDWRNIVGQSRMSAKYNFANIDPAHGDVEISGALNGKGEASKQWVHLNGFDASRFGWKSNQTDTRVDGRGGIVEIQRSRANDNMYAEITASQANTYLYQDIDTAHDYPTVYTVKLRYTHRNGTINSNEKIQILVGAPGHEQPVEMTRIASDRGNRLGEKSTTVNAPNTDGWLGSWDTFQGSVVVPAGRNVSRFTFKALGSIDGISGNLIDDVQFKLAYKLSYDKNSQDAFGQVPSDETANTVKQAKTRTTGTVRAVADRTASGLTVHDLETDDVPGDYRQFVLNTTDTRLSQVEFENGAWYRSTDSSSQGMWPLRIGASLTIPSVGDWTDPSGKTHQISMTMRLKDWNGGSVSELYRFDGHGNIVGDGRFWINTAYGSGYSSLPAKVKAAMGGVDTSKRVGCSWTVEFTYADTGEKVPDAFKGVTGFNDLDGWDAQSDLKFEGVQLLDGFNGAYKRSDAELGTYGTNGFAGIGHDAGDEAHLNAPQQSRHRLAATWTGSTFTFSYDLSNPAGRTDGSRMTFGAPVTRTAVLTYDKNAADASGQVPSNTTPDTTQTASSKSTGKVSDLVQRTTTHEDGSVTVKTIDTSTDVVSGCQVYYPAGQRLTLATLAKDDDCWDASMLTRPGHTQLGWNQDRNATQAQAQVTMVEGGMTVFAVWVGNPVLTYDTNKPSTWTGEMPSTPASVSVAYNTAAADGSGWQAGDVSKIRGYKFLGWYTGPQDNAGLYDWNTLLTGSVTVYAHWQRLQANVIYDKNGGTGSHANTTGWQYSDVTVPGDTSKSFKRDGYYFKYWNTQKDGKGTTYKDGGQVPLQDKDVTLYAIWAPYHTVITETGGVGLPVLVAAGMGLLVVGIGSTVMLTRRMRGEQ